MNIEFKQVKTFTIDLDEEEAKILRGWAQNPVSDCETASENQFRTDLFHFLDDVLDH